MKSKSSLKESIETQDTVSAQIKKRNITFVLGAGASKGYRFPTGIELASNIKSSIETSTNRIPFEGNSTSCYDILNKVIPGKPDTVKNFKKRFPRCGLDSIDIWLSHQKEEDIIKCGKYSIAIELIQKESPNVFFAHKNDEIEKWYNQLLQFMKIRYEDISDNNISFITFNYDRSLEFFLHESIYNTFPKLEKDKIKVENLIANNIKIIHVYGKLGEFTFAGEDSDTHRAFGTKLSKATLDTAIKPILTMGEARKTRTIEEAKDLLKQSAAVVFIGFGFDTTNLEILDLPQSIKHENVYSCGYKVSPNKRLRIDNLFNKPVLWGKENDSCSPYFERDLFQIL